MLTLRHVLLYVQQVEVSAFQDECIMKNTSSRFLDILKLFDYRFFGICKSLVSSRACWEDFLCKGFLRGKKGSEWILY